MTPIIKVDQITKKFGGIVALRGVHLEVQPGEFHALLGENGAGKSTLIKIIGGIYAPDNGQIIIQGQTFSYLTPSLSRKLGISIVHQESSIYSELDNKSNFALGQEPLRFLNWVDWRAVRSSFEIQSRKLNVSFQPDINSGYLSVGQQKILDLMRLLQNKHQLIILDEPTAALTIDETNRLLSILQDLKKDNVAILYVTHRLQEIEDIVDRVTILKDGKNVGTLPPHEATQTRIISLMVGREVKEIYPPSEFSKDEASASLLIVENLSQKPKFENVNFKINSGEIIALVGLTGHGAFEVAHSMFGDPPPQEGKITIRGSERLISKPKDALANNVGFIAEDRSSNIFSILSVRDNISIANIKSWSKWGWIKQKLEYDAVERLTRLLGIRARNIFVKANTLSGGNQQKLVIGRWLASNSQILVMIEPTAGVDVGSRAEIYKLMRNHVKNGGGVLLATSDLNEALGVADRIYAFYRGNIVAVFPRNGCSKEKVVAAITGHINKATKVERNTLAPRFHKINSTIGTKRINANLINIIPAILLLFLMLYGGLLVPNFSTVGNIRNILVQSLPLLVTSVGQSLTIFCGGIDLSIGEVITLSSIIASDLMKQLGIPLTVLIALNIGCSIGYINYFLVEKLGLPPFLATLATMFALQGLNIYLRPVPGGYIPPEFRLIATVKVGNMPLASIVTLVILALFAIHLSYSRWGLHIKAVGYDVKKANLCGISPSKVKKSAYLISAILASLAGLFLAARTGSADPYIGQTYVFDSITATVLGGASLSGGSGSLWGTIASAYILAMLSNILNLSGVTAFYQWIIRGLILIGAVTFYRALELLKK
jgi:ABC-type sugar transport system ATPase subunit/ribose/xylose/arabinose/galactoside ABC-type transport system permease subunit